MSEEQMNPSVEETMQTNVQETESANTEQQQIDELASYRNEDGNLDESKILELSNKVKSFRKTISRQNDLPDNVDDYSLSYKRDSRYDHFFNRNSNDKNLMEQQRQMKEMFKELDQLSLEIGINKDRNHSIKDFLLKKLGDDWGALDLRSDEDIANAHNEYQTNLTNRLRADFENQDLDTIALREDLGNWAKSQFSTNSGEDSIIDSWTQTPEGIELLYKIKEFNAGRSIPTVNIDSNYDVAAAWREYDRYDTTTERREELLRTVLKGKMHP